MGCACEHKRLAGELDRIRRLAKIAAALDGVTYAVYDNGDGTYGFCAAAEARKKIVEYVSKY